MLLNMSKLELTDFSAPSSNEILCLIVPMNVRCFQLPSGLADLASDHRLSALHGFDSHKQQS